MTEVASAVAAAPAIAVPKHLTAVEEEIRDTSVVDVLKAQLQAAKGVDAPKLDELQERVRSDDTTAVPSIEKVKEVEETASNLKETEAGSVDTKDAAVPTIAIDATPGSGTAEPTRDSVPEVQATLVETTDRDAKTEETGLEVSSDDAKVVTSKAEIATESKESAAEPTLEDKDVVEAVVDSETPAPAPEAETKTETVLVETDTIHQLEQAAKTEDVDVPEAIVTTAKVDADANVEVQEPVKEDEPVKVIEEPAEKSAKEAPASVPVADEVPPAVEETPVVVGVPEEEPSANSTPLVETHEASVVAEAPTTVKEPNEESLSTPVIETETKLVEEVAPVVTATEPEAEEPAKGEPVEVEEPLVSAEEPAAAISAEAEVPVQADIAPSEVVPNEPVESEAKAQEVKLEVETELTSDVPAKDGNVEEPEAVQQPAEVEAAEAPTEESVLVDTSVPEPPVEAPALTSGPTEIHAEQEKAKVVVGSEAVPDVEPPEEAQQEPSVPASAPADGTETGANAGPDLAATKAYELAHAHANDEVVFDTPTDEEIKEVASSEVKEEAEAPAPSLVPEPSVEVSPTEDVAIAPEHAGEERPSVTTEIREPEVPVVAEAKAEVAPEVSPEALPVEPDNTDVEVPKAVEPESIAAPEETAETADVPAPIVESEDQLEDKEIFTSSKVKDEVEVEAGTPAPSANAPSTEDVAPAPEVAKDEELPVVTETEEPEVPASADVEAVKTEEPVETVEPEPVVGEETAEVPAPTFAEPGDGPKEKEIAPSEVEEATEGPAPPVDPPSTEDAVPAPEVAKGEEPPEVTEIKEPEVPVISGEKVEETAETVEPQPVVEESTDAPAPTIAEPEDKPEEKDVAAPPPEATEETKASIPPTEVAATEDVKTTPELVEDKEHPVDAPKEADATDFADKVVEEVSEPAADVPVEAVAEVVAEAPPKEVAAEPEEETPAVVSEDAKAVTEEPVKAVLLESPIDEQKSDEEPVPASVETELAVEEVVSEGTASVEEATRAEDKVDDVAKEEPIVEVAEEVPSSSEILASDTDATSADIAEPLVIHEDVKAVVAETETSAPEVTPAEEATEVQVEDPGVPTEAEGALEPFATPATGGTTTEEKVAPSDGLAVNIEQVDELLQEGSAEEATEEVEKAIPEVPTAPAKEPAEAHEPLAPVVEEPEVQESVKDAELVSVPEPAEIVLAEEEPATRFEDEAKPAVEHEEIPEPEAVVASDSTVDTPAVPEEHESTPEVTIAQPQAEDKSDSAALEAHDSETVKDAGEEEPEEVEAVPDVLVETPTPSSEILSFTSSEDDEEDDIPVELRLAKAVGIPPEEVAKLPTLSLSTPTEVGTEDEATTPTEIKNDGGVEETPSSGVQDHETPTQSIPLEGPEDHEATPATELGVDTSVAEVPERPRSPWTPSYSVITQGTSPVHPEEPEVPEEEEPTLEKVGEVVPEKTIVEESSPQEVSQPSEVADVKVLAAVPAPDTETVDSAATETPAPEPIAEDAQNVEETPVLPKDNVKQEAPVLAEVHQAEPSDETLINETPEVPFEPVPATLAVDTSAKEVPERPKSPWTPSYSVTKVGAGVPEPEELHLDADVPAESKVEASGQEQEQQAIAKDEQDKAPQPDATEVPRVETPTPETAPVIERPKSPYPPSYSVTQMGPGQVEETIPAGEFEEGLSIVSNEPEPPLTPRSELGAVTPGFDTQSEVSESSHIPIAPDSPRTDPEVTSLSDAEVKTPLVAGTDEQDKSISPLSTPLLSAKAVEELGASEPLTEAVVSGIEDAEPRSLFVENDGREAAQSDLTDLTAQATEETVVATETKDSRPSVPELTVHLAPPVIVTNTLSTDSAYTQTSDIFSPSQETTGTNVTTPDVETIPIPKLHDVSDIESLGEEPATHASEEPSTITPTGTVGKGKSLGVAHTLAMRSFPSAFTQTEGPSTSEQPKQAPDVDTLEVDDQLSPLASRRRLESTVSTLAFPGGWVSTPAKKERASLEVATGEFSRPTVEVSNPLSPVATPPQTEPASEQSPSKWRCVIM